MTGRGKTRAWEPTWDGSEHLYLYLTVQELLYWPCQLWCRPQDSGGCAILLHGNRFIIKQNIQTHSLGNIIACKLRLYKKLVKDIKFKCLTLLTENTRKYFKRPDTVRGGEDADGTLLSMSTEAFAKIYVQETKIRPKRVCARACACVCVHVGVCTCVLKPHFD